jgi:hypothetical protein
VPWLEITSVHAKTGAPLAHNRLLTHQRWSAANVSQVAPAGRGRWKIANDNNNVITTKGDHVEQNFGHGKQSLAALLLRLNLLAFLFHPVMQGCDDKEALLRQTLGRRQTFFDDIRAFTRSMVFEHWHHLMDCMIRGLELESKLDTG